ncbi:MAG: DUF3108 domain-containing protein [Desulfuromonadaceae bacterium]
MILPIAVIKPVVGWEVVRGSLLRCWLLLLLGGLLFWAPEVAAESMSGFDRLLNQQLCYSMDFLWFHGIARGSFRLTRGERDGTYRAVLEARTQGLAAWLTADREQRYVSVMERTPEGELRALSHESQIVKGRGAGRRVRTKRYRFDHDRRQVFYQRGKEGVFGRQKVLSMPPGSPPNDILTAFFNFREGVFGPLVVGGHYRIPTFSRQGTAYIEAEILAPSRRQHTEFFPPEGLLVKVMLDPEVFETTGGGFYFQFDELLQPARGLVENVIGLGDVRGTLLNSSQ